MVVFLLSQLVNLALLAAAVVLWADAVSWPGITWGQRPAWRVGPAARSD